MNQANNFGILLVNTNYKSWHPHLDEGENNANAMQTLKIIGELCTVNKDVSQPHCCHQMIAVTSGECYIKT